MFIVIQFVTGSFCFSITITCLCNLQRFFTSENDDNFQLKMLDPFFVFAQNIDYGNLYIQVVA